VSRHESAHLHVSGEARYTDDVAAPHGTLHAAIGTAPIAHGRIKALDLAAVRAAPGVVAVFTASDIPGANNYGGIKADDPILCEGLIEYHGQPVFLVVATSHMAARRAARLARIETEALPAIIGLDAALAAQSYLAPPREMKRGDAEEALRSARHRVTGRTRCGAQDHFYLEGQVSLAEAQEDGALRVLCSTQHPTEVQHMVAHALNLDAADVRVECRRMGGGFGGKESQPALFACLAALASRATGRAVKLRLDRDDDMIITGKRHPFHIEYVVGFDAQGRILAADVLLASDCGYSSDLSGPVNDRAVCHVDNAYFIEHLRVKNLQLKTHTVSNTAFRGFGGPQGMFGLEHAIDAIARRLKRDPLEIRRLNYYGVSSRNVTPYGQTISDNILEPVTQTLLARSDYTARRVALHAANAISAIVKRGIAITPVKFGISFNATHLNQAGALVQLYADGSVLINHGGTEMGQGLFTKVAQVAAREFGLPLASVRVSAADTSKVPNTSATAASSGSDLNGMAVREACLTLRARLAAHAARRYGVEEAQIKFEDGQVMFGEKRVAFADLCRSAWMARVSLSTTGYYSTPVIHWQRETLQGHPFYYFAYGAACTQVAIDTLTGESRIERVDIVHDVGTSLNAALDIGQIEGGFVQGAGWLTSEELCFSSDGRITTHAPSTYKIPTAADVPTQFNVHLLEDAPNPVPTIYRSKAVGEPPFMLALSVFSAISDAVHQAGGDADSLTAPCTPETILRTVMAPRSPAINGLDGQMPQEAQLQGVSGPSDGSNAV
jgi:xanthine dehydrogenase large subunit